MQELIPIKVKNDQQLVSARDLHQALELKRRFSAWTEQNFKDFEKGSDFWSVLKSTQQNQYGGVKQVQDYAITLDMAKELCMMSKTEKGKEIRKYFIEVEKQWNDPVMVMNRALSISNAQVKALKSKNLELETKKTQLEDKIKHDEDDVLFSRAIRYSNQAIKIRELAAILTQNGFVIGQNQLYELLRAEKYISKHGRLPMGDKQKRGYFRVVHGVSNGKAWSTTLVTPKGQQHIINQALRGKFDDNYQRVVTGAVSI